jgi:CubicO group peptidase (beta-lactamase class C family)
VLFESAYGIANRAWRIPCSTSTRFDTASITKLFTAVATLQQIERGAFGLDTGVVEFLGLSGTALSPAVTPYHLLTHTSGIADDADEEDGERYEDLFVERPNYSVIELADHLDQFVDKPPKFAPGEGTRYNNVAYILLGLMVERSAQVSYRDYVTTNVFAPAGMDRSGFFRMDIVEPDVAEGAEPIVDDDGRIAGWHRNIYSYPPIGSPDGGAHTTPHDLIRFHDALRAGALLGPESTAAMLSPKEVYKPRGAGTHYTGFGFEFETDAEGAVQCYWKEGINVGVSGALSYYPREDITTAMLCNIEDAAWEPIKVIERMIAAA